MARGTNILSVVVQPVGRRSSCFQIGQRRQLRGPRSGRAASPRGLKTFSYLITIINPLAELSKSYCKLYLAVNDKVPLRGTLMCLPYDQAAHLSRCNVGSSGNALWAPRAALRATHALSSPRALRGCMVFRTKSGLRPAQRLRRN